MMRSGVFYFIFILLLVIPVGAIPTLQDPALEVIHSGPEVFLDHYMIPMSGNSIHVGGTGPDNLTSIQDAVNSSEDLDTIIVHGGHWTEQVKVNRSVRLIGEDTPVMNGSNHGEEPLLEITSDNVTVNGFEFRGSHTAILANASGFLIENNIFRRNQRDVFWFLERIYQKDDLKIYGSSFKENEVIRNMPGSYNPSFIPRIKVFFQEDGGNLTMGDLNITGNVFNGTSGWDRHIEMNAWLNVLNYDNGSVRSGDINIMDNVFNGSDMGIWIYTSTYEKPHNAHLDLGNITILNNTFARCSGSGVMIHPPLITSMSGNSTLKTGDISIVENSFNMSAGYDFSTCIRVREEGLHDQSDNTSIIRGKCVIGKNDMVITGPSPSRIAGINLTFTDTGVDMRDNASYISDLFRIEDNLIYSNEDAIRVRVHDIGSHNKGGAVFRHEGLRITGNRLFSDRGIYFGDISCIGCDMENNTISTMGNITVNDNEIHSRVSALSFDPFGDMGCGMSGDSSMSFGGLSIKGNDIRSNNGEWVNDPVAIDRVGVAMSGTSSVSIGGISIRENVIRNSSSTGAFSISRAAESMFDDSTFSMGDLEYVGNTLRNSKLNTGGYTMSARYLHNGSRASFGKIRVNDNDVISNDGGGIKASSFSAGNYLKGNSSVLIGGMEVFQNDVRCQEGVALEIGSVNRIGYWMENGSSLECGNLKIGSNRVSGSGKGIVFNGLYGIGQYLHDNSSLVFSGLSMDHNVVNSTDEGLHLGGMEKICHDAIGNSTVDISMVEISNNTIRADDHGIVVEYLGEIGSRMNVSARLYFKGIRIDHNDVDASIDSIRISSIFRVMWYLHGSAEVEMESISIDHNHVSGMITIADTTEMMNRFYGSSSVSFHGFHLHGNTIRGGGIQIGQLGNSLSHSGDDSFTRMGRISVRDNTISSYGNGIGIGGGSLMESMMDNSSARWDGIDVSENEITAVDTGIEIRFTFPVRSVFNGSIAEIGRINVCDNIIEATDGLVMDMGKMSAFMDSYLSVGSVMVNGSVFDVSRSAVLIRRVIRSMDRSVVEELPCRVSWNEIYSENTGLGLESVLMEGSSRDGINGTHEIYNNQISGPYLSFMFNTTSTSYVYLNNVHDTQEDGYSLAGNTIFNSPDNISYHYLQSNLKSKLGNHWENHHGVDHNNDGIIDTPYLLSGGVDNYPLLFNWTDMYPPINDTTAPSIDINIEEGTVFTSSNITITWSSMDTGVGVSRFIVSLDGGEPFDNGRATFTDLFALRDGSHTITVTAVDHLGNERSRTLSFWVDTTKPTVSIISPEQGDILSPGDLPLIMDWEAFDTGTGIVDLVYRIDDNPPVNTSDLSSPVEYGSSLSDGYHNLTVQVTDGAGYVSGCQVDFGIDTTPPVVVFTQPPWGDAVRNTSILVSWEATDEISGLQGNSIRIDRREWSVIGLDNNRSFHGLSEGLHLVEVLTTDAVGNSVTNSVQFTVDRSLPTLDVIGIEDGVHLNAAYLNVLVEANGTGSKIIDFNATLDGEVVDISDGRISVSYLSEGEHILIISASDRANNKVRNTYTFTVDRMDPRVVDMMPGSEDVGTNSTISLILNEELSSAELFLESPFTGGVLVVKGNVVEFVPNDLFATSTDYRLGFSFTDLAGNVAEETVEFRTSEFHPGFGGYRSRVMDPDGDPVEGAELRIQGRLIGTTDQDGVFNIELSEGEHFMEISSPGFKMRSIEVEIISGEMTEGDDIVLDRKAESGSISTYLVLMIAAAIMIIVAVGISIMIVRSRPDDDMPDDVFLVEGEDYFEDDIYFE